MMSFNTRFKAVALVVSLMISSQATAFSLPFIGKMTSKKTAVLSFLALWIHLKTKDSSGVYDMADFNDDLNSLFSDYSVFDINF